MLQEEDTIYHNLANPLILFVKQPSGHIFIKLLTAGEAETLFPSLA